MFGYPTVANIADPLPPPLPPPTFHATLVLHVPHQLSSFSPFNYGRLVKIAVSTIGTGRICGSLSSRSANDISTCNVVRPPSGDYTNLVGSVRQILVAKPDIVVCPALLFSLFFLFFMELKLFRGIHLFNRSGLKLVDNFILNYQFQLNFNLWSIFTLIN